MDRIPSPATISKGWQDYKNSQISTKLIINLSLSVANSNECRSGFYFPIVYIDFCPLEFRIHLIFVLVNYPTRKRGYCDGKIRHK